MVSVTPLGMLSAEVTLYGPPVAVQVVLMAMVPPSVVVAPRSYHTSTLTVANTTLLLSRDWTTRRLTPGLSPRLFVQVPRQAVHTAACPFTSTERVSMTLACPLMLTAGMVV